MFRSINRFVANTRGAFALQFAMMAIPLTVCTGLAIDGGRAFLARFELAAALDAAALAVGSTLTEGTDLNAVAAKFVERNFRTQHDEPISLELVEGIVNGAETYTLKGQVKISTYFMPLVGQPYVTVSAESEVRQGGNNVEVALALDITQSMNVTRMEGLKSAANLLIGEVVSEQQPPEVPFFSRAAIVPWSQYINLSKTGSSAVSHVTGTALNELRGTLVGSRSISAASWRTSGMSNMSISEAGWRTTAGSKAIRNAANNGTGGVDWRWGASVAISSFAKITVGSSSNRIRVTTTNDHGYANGQFIRITGAGGSYTGLNNNVYRVGYSTSSPDSNTTKNFYLRKLDDSGWVAQPTGNTSSSAASQRCYDSACNIGVTTSNAFTGLSANDHVNITGVSGFTAINNSDTTTWQVAAVMTATNTFTLSNWDGPSQGAMNAGGGAVSECLVSDCRYRVTTGTTNHNFLNSDFVAIWGVSESGSGTSANSALNTTWHVADPSGTVFYLPGGGKTYKDWTSGGSAAECQLETCNTRITVGASTPNRDLFVGDYIEIKSAKGMTGINNTTGSISSPYSPARVAWKISAVSGNVLTLEDSSPAFGNMTGNYTNSGTAQCLTYGCQRYGFVVSGGDATDPSDYRVYRASPCLVERPGANAYTDANPSTSPLGISYTSGGTCTQTNYVTPLTDDRQRLFDAIDDLDTDGSTAGQLGVAWGWYMLSNNFATVWDKEPENVPQPKSFNQLARVLVLMTDGEFNFATCNGVTG